MLLIQQTEEDIADALQSWDWLNFSGKTPIAITAFGHVFFESESGIFFLDSVDASLEKVAETKEELQCVLNTAEGQDHFLMAGLVVAARDSGLFLSEGECYDFIISPSLGGEMSPDNLQKIYFKASLHCTGQLMKQIKDLPVGTKISSVKLDGA